MTPSETGPSHDPERIAPAAALGALALVFAALGFAVPWWIENGASVYLSRLLDGLILCL